MPARILTDARGRTLYLFAQDKHNKSVCTGQCAAFWPPLLLPKGTSVSSTLPGIAGTFGVATRAGGARQLTYDGSPLYTFKEDRKAGQMRGQGVLGVWWVVVVNSAPTSGNAAAPSPTAAPASSATATSSVPAPVTPTSGAAAPATPTPSGGYHGGGY